MTGPEGNLVALSVDNHYKIDVMPRHELKLGPNAITAGIMKVWRPLMLATLTGMLVGEPVPVEVREPLPGRFELWRAGAPYFVRGAGATDRIERLAAAGANSVRTWDPEQTARVFDDAQRLGLTVCAGIWIEHEHQGCDYNDEASVREQIERHRRTVDRFKDHPALLMWGVGNEVELQGSNPKVWDAVEAVAAYIKKVDSHHPVMTVTAHVPPAAIQELMRRCPSVDILGVNSYRGVPEIAEAVRTVGWRGPYLVTEWGCNGTWEVDVTPWGAEIEPTSTEKAVQRAYRYAAILSDRERCLGSYAFLWGQKQEGTPTWFGVFTEDGAETESVEMLEALWRVRNPTGLTPRVGQVSLNGEAAIPGVRLSRGVRTTATCPLLRGEKLRVRWELLRERVRKSIGGGFETRPVEVALAGVHERMAATEASLEFSAPEEKGAYRLYAYVYAPGGQVATANFPFWVE